jgi:hypothetical protein
MDRGRSHLRSGFAAVRFLLVCATVAQIGAVLGIAVLLSLGDYRAGWMGASAISLIAAAAFIPLWRSRPAPRAADRSPARRGA